MKRVLLAIGLLLSAGLPGDIPGQDHDVLSGNPHAAQMVGFLHNVDPASPRPGFTWATASHLYGMQVEDLAADGTS